MVAPKTYYGRDILIIDDVPIFFTSMTPVMLPGKVANVEGKNAMIEVRWWKFQLSVQMPLS